MPSFVTFQGYQGTDPYAPTADKRIILSHPSVTDSLVITELENYSPNWENWLNSTERTPAGSLAVVGGTRLPLLQVPVTATVNKDQLNMLEEIKRWQDYTIQGITIQDYFQPVVYIPTVMSAPSWLSGYPTTDSRGRSVGFASSICWLDFPIPYSQYKGYDWYQVQFTLKQV
jgi:hypothetical protein